MSIAISNRSVWTLTYPFEWKQFQLKWKCEVDFIYQKTLSNYSWQWINPLSLGAIKNLVPISRMVDVLANASDLPNPEWKRYRFIEIYDFPRHFSPLSSTFELVRAIVRVFKSGISDLFY